MWKTEMVEFSNTQSPQNPRLETELRKNHIKIKGRSNRTTGGNKAVKLSSKPP
jgi:hypothetical protein